MKLADRLAYQKNMSTNLNKDLMRYEQEKREFIDGLRLFHNGRGTSFYLLPRCGQREIDLCMLYQKVTARGGWKKVTENQKWDEVIDELGLPKACLNVDQALKYIYIRYLNIYEQINFLGDDPKTVDQRRDDEGPIRKKHCGPQYSVPLAYNVGQHDVAHNLREGYGLATTYARHSEYDKLEKALLSGLPNEVDFAINVCTLLSNESKHTLHLDKCAVLTKLLLAHIGIFEPGDIALEKLYENGWRKLSKRDFIWFWYDTVRDEEGRQMISFTRSDPGKSIGQEVLQLGRTLGADDKEGIRITQIAIIIRNLSFDRDNMKFLANSDLIFRFLMLCAYSSYGTLRQLALDTLGNLSAQFVLDPADSFKSKTILNLLVQCITSSDKFAVVTGLEMVSKLSQLEENEYVLSEKLDISMYEEITKYLTIQDIQLIVFSLEALYQLSEIGEETNSKIAEVSSIVDTLISLITVEAQSYGPNSLVGIKVVEYCPPPHLTGGVTGAVGPPTPQQSSGQSSAASTDTPQKSVTWLQDKVTPPEPPKPPSPMETTTCNWLKATFDVNESGNISHLTLYTEYLYFCKKFHLSQALSSKEFLNALKIVFPRSRNTLCASQDGTQEMCAQGIKMRPQQLPFSISCSVPKSAVSNVTPSTTLQPSSAVRSPNLAQRLLSPPSRPIMSVPLRPMTATNPPIYTTGMTVHPVATRTPVSSHPFTASTTVSTITAAVAARGYITDPQPQHIMVAPNTIVRSTSNKTKGVKRSKCTKNTPILPRPEQGSHPALVPKVQQIQVAQHIQQQPILPNVQFAPQDFVYQTVDPQNPDSKIMVKTLLAQKIRHGTVIIQQPVLNMDLSAGDGQSIPTYQTSYPQSVHTTYIQYGTQPGTVYPTVQNIIHQQPTSQVQTFVVHPDDMIVQGQMSASSVSSQMVTQQPIMVSQQPFFTQQQILYHQSQVMPPQQLASQPQFISQSQLISNSLHSSQVSSQMALSSSSSGSLLVTCPTSSVSVSSSSALVNGPVDNISSSQTILHTSSNTINNNILQSQTPHEICENVHNGNEHVINEAAAIQTMEKICQKPQEKCNEFISDKPSVLESDVNNSAQNVSHRNEYDSLKLDISCSSEAEIESAVGSIMDDTIDSQDEEPVMIENDGNELLFEQRFHVANESVGHSYQEVCEINENYEDELSLAAEQLEHMEQSEDIETNTAESLENEMYQNVSMNVENDDQVQMLLEDNIDTGQCVLNSVEYKEGSVEKETVVSDADLIAKFRAETPISVPIVVANGLFEQDFEARMAVENLLKDVEFKVNDDSLEADMNVFSCQQSENIASIKTINSNGENGCSLGEDNQDCVISESQNGIKTSLVNHNGAVIIPKDLENITHTPQNGIDSGGCYELILNGDVNLDSPDSPQVPFLGLVNGEDHTKLVNGISNKKAIEKVIKMNGVVNHKILPISHESDEIEMTETKVDSEIKNIIHVNKVEDILTKTIKDSDVDKNGDVTIHLNSIENSEHFENKKSHNNKDERENDILARSILENNIQPSDCEMPEPASLNAVVKQIIPSTVYGSIMTVQINSKTIPITFSNTAIITSQTSFGNQINVCNSRHIPTPETARDGELSCDSTSSLTTSELGNIISEKHSIGITHSKSQKVSKKSLASPKSSEVIKTKSKKRSRNKSGGSGDSDSRPSSVSSPASAAATPPPPEFMCEWAHCHLFFDNARNVFCHVCSVHLKTEYDGLCKWDGCETLVRKRWSLFTHVQDHHCSESSLRVAAQRRIQSFQTGQKIAPVTVPAMVYPNDAANQAIKRFLQKPPYPEFMEGREGPVTKHIRLTSALILRNLAKYSPAGRSLLKKHERMINYTCMSAVESSTALAKCLFEINEC